MTWDEQPSPATESMGDLGPPGRRPPTAVGAETPGEPPPPPPPRARHVHAERRVEIHILPGVGKAVGRAVGGIMAAMDRVAATIESELGLRTPPRP